MADIKLTLKTKTGIELVFDKYHGLKSISVKSQSQPDPNTIQYGILTATGTMEAIDVDRNILENINKGEIDYANIDALLSINGSIKQHFIVTESNYDNNQALFTVNFSDRIELLKSYFVDDKKWTGAYSKDITKSFKEILYEAFAKVGYSQDQVSELLQNKIYISKYGDMPESVVTIENYLGNIRILGSAYYQKKCSVYELIDKICKAAQLVCYLDINGNIHFDSARPTIIPSDFIATPEIINVPNYMQTSHPSETMILNNKYDNVIYKSKNSNMTIQRTFSQTFSLGGGTEIDLKNVPESSIREIGGTKYICQFITTNGGFNVASSTVTYGNDSVRAISGKITGETPNGVSTSKEFELAYILNAWDGDTKETYDFSDDALRLPYYNSLTSDVLGIRYNTSGLSKFESIEANVIEYVDNPIYTEKLFNSKSNPFEFVEDNEFLSDQTVYRYSSADKDIPLYNILFNHITNDYAGGVKSAVVTVIGGDYNTNKTRKFKNWANGDIIDVGDIVKLQGTSSKNSVWKVVGRTIRKAGCPFIDLELMEVIPRFSDRIGIAFQELYESGNINFNAKEFYHDANNIYAKDENALYEYTFSDGIDEEWSIQEIKAKILSTNYVKNELYSDALINQWAEADETGHRIVTPEFLEVFKQYALSKVQGASRFELAQFSTITTEGSFVARNITLSVICYNLTNEIIGIYKIIGKPVWVRNQTPEVYPSVCMVFLNENTGQLQLLEYNNAYYGYGIKPSTPITPPTA